MVNEEQEIKKLLVDFNKMIERYPDNQQYTQKFVNLLRVLLRLQNDTNPIPIAEIMTIIRYKKPEIFYTLQLRGRTDFTFDFLTGLEVELAKAESTFQSYLGN